MNDAEILVVEDDVNMQRLLASQLTTRGYSVRIAGSGGEALKYAQDGLPEMVLLDIGLPDMDGIEVCRRLRALYSVPIIMVTASDTPQTKVSALEIGGDDYLTKPFHMGELIARIRAVLRRVSTAKEQASDQVYSWDLIRMDLDKREVMRDNVPLHLTKIEFELLKALVKNRDRAMTYEQLLLAVWGPGNTDVRPVHVHICNLRRKLEPGLTSPRRILAIPGVGYRFRGPQDD